MQIESGIILDYTLLNSKRTALIEWILWNDDISILIVGLLSQQLYKDTPGSPGVADLPPTHGVVIDLQQLLNDVPHPKDIEIFTPPLLYRQTQNIFVYHQQLICILAMLTHLPVQNYYLL